MLGNLQASKFEDQDDRFFTDRPGVKLHAWQNARKVTSYLTYLRVECTAPDGAAFSRAVAVQNEAMHGETKSNRKSKKADQVIQPEESVVLTSLIPGLAENVSWASTLSRGARRTQRPARKSRNLGRQRQCQCQSVQQLLTLS